MENTTQTPHNITQTPHKHHTNTTQTSLLTKGKQYRTQNTIEKQMRTLLYSHFCTHTFVLILLYSQFCTHCEAIEYEAMTKWNTKRNTKIHYVYIHNYLHMYITL